MDTRMVLEITRFDEGGLALVCAKCRSIIWQGNESWFKRVSMAWLTMLDFLWEHQCKVG